MNDDAWLYVASVVVEVSAAVTVLRIDTSDTQAACVVAMMQGGCDAIGAYPPGGLAILLPDCPPANGDAVSRRLRIAMKYHKIDCRIASASKPRDGLALGDLLAVCEAELVVAERGFASLGQFVLASPGRLRRGESNATATPRATGHPRL